jgi:hypothetical protein
MSWEQGLLDLFDDLEARAAGMAQARREEDVADLARAEYAGIGLAERLQGSVGGSVVLELTGGPRLRGRLERVGRGCAVLTPGDLPVMHLVNLTHVVTVATASPRAAVDETLPVTSRLGLASAVRHLTEEVDAVAVRLADGRPVSGQVVRVGADFLEVFTEDAAAEALPVLVPLAAVVTLAPA